MVYNFHQAIYHNQIIQNNAYHEQLMIKQPLMNE